MLFHLPKLPTELRIKHLNARIEEQRKRVKQYTGSSKSGIRHLISQIKKETIKHKKKAQKIYLLDFKGDIHASAVADLREEITLILASWEPEQCKIIVRLESPGGVVHGYGLAAAQLIRLREAGFHLTICVDKVAASGGYMMACIANQIIAAPFAILGSIGVVAQLPNFNKLLKKHDIDYNIYTAGEYKRTVTMFGENSEQGEAKFEQELQQTHQLFKHFVEKYRPAIKVDEVATGEHWYGEDALKLNLVDKLQTSDSYLLGLLDEYDIYSITTRKKPTLGEKLGLQVAELSQAVLPSVLDTIANRLQKIPFSRIQAVDDIDIK